MHPLLGKESNTPCGHHHRLYRCNISQAILILACISCALRIPVLWGSRFHANRSVRHRCTANAKRRERTDIHRLRILVDTLDRTRTGCVALRFLYRRSTRFFCSYRHTDKHNIHQRKNYRTQKKQAGEKYQENRDTTRLDKNGYHHHSHRHHTTLGTAKKHTFTLTRSQRIPDKSSS